MGPPPVKSALRAEMRARRSRRSSAERAVAAQGFRQQALSLPPVAEGPRVAAFIGGGGEPDTLPLLDALHARRVSVLLPVLLDDDDLDWACYSPGRQAQGRLGLPVPTTPGLGVDSVSTVSAVLCPGLAVDHQGRRLGRGGGSYDRALARCGADVLRCQLAYDDEVVAAVPTASHDQPVDVIVTPTRVVWTSAREE